MVDASSSLVSPTIATTRVLDSSLDDARLLSPHDSKYASGASTPAFITTTAAAATATAATLIPAVVVLNDALHFDTHICSVPGCEVDHEFDHWESPVHWITLSHSSLRQLYYTNTARPDRGKQS